MADTWWFEEIKLLIALWIEEAVQHELNTMHHKKLVWDKKSHKIVDGGYSRSAQQCRVKINNLKQKYRNIRDGNKISGGQRQRQRQEREIFEPMDFTEISTGSNRCRCRLRVRRVDNTSVVCQCSVGVMSAM